MVSCPYMTNRGPLEGLVPLTAFFTPDAVSELALQIVAESSKHPINAVMEWVASNVPYRTDYSMFNKSDWWQYPVESIAAGCGDCEDESFLVASLLLSLGYLARVGIGNTPFGYHAWCECQDENGCWWLLESTVGRAFRIDSRAALGYELDLVVDYFEGCRDPADITY